MTTSISSLANWNNKVADAVGSVGSLDFPSKLEIALSALIDFDICMVFSYSSKSPSKILHHNLDSKNAKIIIHEYLEGPYLLDPFYSAAIRGKRDGIGVMRTLAPDQFYRSEFYRHHYVRTGIADEIGLFFNSGHETTSVLSITRQKPQKKFTERDKKLFSAASHLLSKIASIHWSDKKDDKQHLGSKASIDIVFESFGSGILTARERETVALILKGHSSGSIGQVLEISEGTVKNHRKSVYEKLKISSQAELFSLFLKSLRNVLAP